METSIKFKRSEHGMPDDYGRKFTKMLNEAVGGKANWSDDQWPHGEALTTDQKLRIRRFEDGPEFYFNLVNSFAACGSFLISAIALWYSIPKKEKSVGGTRYVELRAEGITVSIDCEKSKNNEKIIKKIVKAVS